MHPITVYGIETHADILYQFQCVRHSCMHPITVYGIETLNCYLGIRVFVACTLLPFTVLKLVDFRHAEAKDGLHAPYYRLRY